MNTTITQLLTDLRRKDIIITADETGERLRVNAPKGALTPDIQEQLRNRKAELLIFLANAGAVKAADSPIIPVSREQPQPLSFGQERVWFLSQWDPTNPVFNLSSVLDFNVNAKVERLGQAVVLLFERHHLLRSAIINQDGHAQQIIRPIPEQPLLIKALPVAGDSDESQQHLAEEARRPFMLETGPLARFCLTRLTDRYRLQMTIHHVAFDGWSGPILLRELMAAYAGELPLAAPVLQYADYAAWQRQTLTDAASAPDLAYWRKQLEGAPALELPTDHVRPAVQQYVGANETVLISGDLVQRLSTQARALGVTPFMFQLAVFNLLLWRHTGQDDLVVGTPISARVRSDLESLIGFFLNNLVLRTRVIASQTFADLVATVRSATAEAYSHQHIPFERLVNELQPKRDLSRPPLFQVLFNHEVYCPPSGWQDVIDHHSMETGTAAYDLALHVREESGQLRLRWEYSKALFEAQTVRDISKRFLTLLEAAVSNPHIPVGDLRWQTANDIESACYRWNKTAVSYQIDATINSLVSAQAQRTPTAVAVRCGDLSLTYAQLEQRSTTLAHLLRQQGVAHETLVGICLERSVDLPVALLAVLKAGGAYVPLDPAFPPQRLAHMAEDAALPVLLTQRSLASLVPGKARQIWLDEIDFHRPDLSTLPATVHNSESLAYVLYTSGSTGRPKGVQIEHRNVVNFLTSMAQAPGLSADDVLYAITTLSFDIAGLELFLPLTVGACIVIGTREISADGRLLREDLVRTGATVMQATPATWQLMLQSDWQLPLPITALCGGEAMSQELATQLLPRCRALWNMYGPTETTIWSTIERITQAEHISVGQAIANTTLYIVDAQGQPLPPGLAGELCIGGDGVARGYHNQPTLTADRFLTKPFAPGGTPVRYYRTGDLARRRMDGRIEVIGRMDHQVKIRGFRIELGDIESALSQHPAIAQAVTLVREDDPGDRRLVAYVIGRSNELISLADVRAFLQQRLPDYMVPSAVMWLTAYPLTPNGKVDRRALPKPERRVDIANFSAPEGVNEIALAKIFSEVLKVEKVSRFDNFFDLGGHSLLSIRVVERFAADTGIRLHPGELFQQTLAQIAAAHNEAPTSTASVGVGQRLAGAFGSLFKGNKR